jgi:dTMP kinase
MKASGRKKMGTFIVLDGVDGGGKTGAARFVRDTLTRNGRSVILTREPGGTPEGLALRHLLLSTAAHDWLPMAELMLMNAARVQHVQKVILPAIRNGDIVICDRFVSASIAYQHAGHGLPENVVRDIHRLAIDDIWPDLTIILDLDPAIGLARSRGRLAEQASDEGRFEALDLDFHKRVRESFLRQAAGRPDRYFVVDANRTPAAVQKDVVERVLIAVGD